MKVSRILVLVLVALLSGLGAGCGGGDGDESTATQPAVPQTAPETSEVAMDEYSFDPKDVVVKRGATLAVKNDGAIAHNLTVEKGPDPKKESRKLAGTSTFVPGKSERLEVDLKPGKYAMVCTVSGHRALGMVGSFTVE